MEFFSRWWRRTWYLLNRDRLAEELRQEIASHKAEMHSDRRRVAAFGNELAIREQAHTVWGWNWLDSIIGDVRFAGRSLIRNAAFSITAIGSLAAGIWLVAVTSTVVGAYVIRALPYPKADRLFHVMYAPPGPWEPPGMSGLNWGDVNDVVEQPITASNTRAYLPPDGNAPPVALRGLRVNSGFVSGLGVRPAIGRVLDTTFYAPDAEASAMISHSLWRTRFNADSAVIGRIFQFANENGQPGESYRIVGVLSQRFYFGRDSRDTVDLITQLRTPFQTYMVRFRDNVTVETARQRLGQAARNVGTVIPPDWTGITLESVHDRYVGSLRPLLRAITVATALIFLIIAVNLAVLVLLRSMRRQKELAVRAALGAGHARLARIPLFEAALITIAAVVPALVLSSLALKWIGPAITKQLGRPSPRGADGLSIDFAVVGVCLVAALTIVVLMSLVPLAATSYRKLQGQLRSNDRSASSGPGMRRIRSTLLAMEIGASLALLIGSGLMVQSALNLLQRPRGFVAADVVRARLAFPGDAFVGPDALVSFYTRFRDQTEAATGARPVFSSWPPFTEPPLQNIEGDGGGISNSSVIGISDGYIPTMRMQIKQGRDFSPTDRVGAPQVAIISETLARALFPNASAIGRQVRHLDPATRETTPSAWLTVIGVVGDMRSAFSDGDQHDLYTSYMQNPPNRFASLTVRSDKGVAWWSNALSASAKVADARVTVGLTGLLVAMDQEGAEARFITALLTTLSAFALALAVIGIIAVTAYSVQQRERETAIRMALGATSRAIRYLFIKDSVRTVVAGSILGTLLALSGSKVLASRVHGVSVFDISTYVAACLGVGAIALGAVWMPAIRAATEQNLRKLRGDA